MLLQEFAAHAHRHMLNDARARNGSLTQSHAHPSRSDDGKKKKRDVTVVIGKPARESQRRTVMQNQQKGVKCTSCNQMFKTHEFMTQHWQDKHKKEVRHVNAETGVNPEVERLQESVKETKMRKLEEDRELLQQQQSQKFRLYDQEEAITKKLLEGRDFAIADRQENQKLLEQQSRAEYDHAAEELRLRQTRLITISSLESEIQEELRDIKRLLESVPLKVCFEVFYHYRGWPCGVACTCSFAHCFAHARHRIGKGFK